MTTTPYADLASEEITFSFGRNWKKYSRFASPKAISSARADIEDWLGDHSLEGKSVVDVGSGSGIHSLCFHRLGAASVVSVDVDPHSVECTNRFRDMSGAPSNWSVRQGTILDESFVSELGTFDFVYSWGVLHHTGDMWRALENAARLCSPESSRLWISIYAKGPGYESALRLKKKYNQASGVQKRFMIVQGLWNRWRRERGRGKRFSQWFWDERGMNAYHDMVDWMGGLPYEVADVEEIVRFYADRGFSSERVKEVREGGCHVYLFSRP